MAEDYGILISQPGSNVIGAKTSQILLNTSKPFIKLDTQNDAAFETITLSLVNDPPEPSGGAQHRYTVVYQFPHGYAYIPALEMLFYVQTPPPATSYTQKYYLDSVILASHSVDDYAAMYAVADKTNVYFVVDKFNDGAGSPNLLTGTNIQITSHIFLNDIGV